MRFLRLMRRGPLTFKKIRIAFTLFKSSFESVYFRHQRYFLLCISLAAIQFIYMKIIGLIHYRLTVGLLITELLAGENFFEILWHDAHFSISANNFFTLLTFIALLYLEIILIYLILSASAHYTFRQQNSLSKSIQASLAHWRTICAWGFLELCVQGSSSLLGNIGVLLYFGWSIITIFDVQILSFDTRSAYGVIKKSWKLFKQNLSEVVAFDVIIEVLIMIAGFILYFISKQYVPSISLLELKNYQDIIIFLILYLISSVMIFEVTVFTNLYKSMGEK